MNTYRMSPWQVTTDPKLLRRMGKTIEEAGELVNVAGRVIIQGIDEIDPGTGKSNRARLLDELADMQAQIDCTCQLLFSSNEDSLYFHERLRRKKANMADWEAQVS